MRTVGAIRGVGAVALLIVAALACNHGLKGRFEATLDGRAVTMRSAYVVSYGGKGFRLYASTDRRGCDWAKRGAVGSMGWSEVYIAFDGARFMDEDGSFRWRARGLHWSGNKMGVGSTDLEWNAALTATATSGCAKHIALSVDAPGSASGKPGHVDIDADVECCEALPASEGPLRATVAGEHFTFTRAGLSKVEGGNLRYRITRVNDPCRDEITHEDALLDATTTPTGEVTALSISGLSFPVFGLQYSSFGRTRHAGDPMITIKGEGITARVRGEVKIEKFRGGRPLPLEVEGVVPLATCKLR